MEDDCLFCNNGIVEAFCGIEPVEWLCPDCEGTGVVTAVLREAQEESLNAMNIAINKSNRGV